MTAAKITRILAGLSFLIFFCPFFQTCSFDSLNFSGQSTAAKTQQQKLAEEQRRTYSGYRLAGISSSTSDDFDNPSIYFSILVVVSAVTLYFAIRGSFDNVFWFSVINLIMIAVCILILLPVYFVLTLMVRYGFYLLLCNTIALIIFSRKAYKQSDSYTFQKPAV